RGAAAQTPLRWLPGRWEGARRPPAPTKRGPTVRRLARSAAAILAPPAPALAASTRLRPSKTAERPAALAPRPAIAREAIPTAARDSSITATPQAVSKPARNLTSTLDRAPIPAATRLARKLRPEKRASQVPVRSFAVPGRARLA